MSLDADAQRVADFLADTMPGQISSLGVDGARRFSDERTTQGLPGPEMASVDDLVVAGRSPRIPIRVYRPTVDVGLPVLVYFHGGGWTIGGLDQVDAVCRALAEKAGCVVVSVAYRLAPEHKFPAAFEDCLAAVEWIHANAMEVGGDARRIAVGGDSAGANLAAACCIAARDRGGPPIVLQLLVYPATEYAVDRPSWAEHANAPVLTADDVVWFWGQYLPDEWSHDDARAFPSAAATLHDLPPAFIGTAEFDPIRDDGENYGRLLRQADVNVTSKRYPGVFHGFFTMVGILNRSAAAIDDCAAALRTAFGRPEDGAG
jgi:acetyl esterase